jgi:uncharacterized membrane protein HdeD (DUF308 family)
MISMLARNWWAFVARGLFAVLFGLIALFMPGVTMLSLVLVFAAYALADGVMAIIGAIHAAKQANGGACWSLKASSTLLSALPRPRCRELRLWFLSP